MFLLLNARVKSNMSSLMPKKRYLSLTDGVVSMKDKKAQETLPLSQNAKRYKK